jgi:hypothetical protein
MQLIKRIELWILLAIIMAGVAWVFLSGNGGEADPLGGDSTANTESASPLQLHRCVLKRDYGNARLDIELRVRNDRAEKLVMQAPKVKLLGEKGREIPSYFLPFDPVPEVAAHSALDVQLRYWLEASDLKESLNLEVDGRRLPIKGSNAFDLNSIKNEEERVMQPGAW